LLKITRRDGPIQNCVINAINARTEKQKEKEEELNNKWKNWKIIQKWRKAKTLYPVEHKYIDFQPMLIRQKINQLMSETKFQKSFVNDKLDNID